CNTERLEARKRAWSEGSWVREGLMAYAAKKRGEKAKAA
ncbi:MAG: 1,2-phenylacetyl-CoA epoxidase subunit A, partial [Pseudomonadota bacterium]